MRFWGNRPLNRHCVQYDMGQLRVNYLGMKSVYYRYCGQGVDKLFFGMIN